ncbi:MAG: NBR1-Ig-like domain-containing protein [Anaerolineae bacterium]
MRCTNCNAELGPTDRFCTTCGMRVPESQLRHGCPQCGAELHASDRFCPKCGFSVPTAGAEPSAAQLAATAHVDAGASRHRAPDDTGPLGKPRRNGDKAWLWALLAAVVMALVGVAALIGAVTNDHFRETLIGSLGFGTPTPQATAVVLPTATEAMQPTAQPSATPTRPNLRAAATATAEFRSLLGLEFVQDVTIPDDTVVQPGTRFLKTWRVRNTGQEPWPAGSRLVYATGDLLGGAASASLNEPVAPGETVDISVSMSAPTVAGSYQGSWQMQASDGYVFGSTLAVMIRVGGSTPTPRASRTPLAAPYVFEMNWDSSWIGIENYGYWASDANGSQYVAELAFLDTTTAVAAIEEAVPQGWKAKLIMRDQVGWVSCTANVCQEHSVDNAQQLVTNQLYLSPEVWTSLLTDFQAGGWQAMTKNANYADIQEAAFGPIGEVPQVPCLTFRFTPTQ